VSCHGNGICTLTSGLYICVCNLRWDPETNCSVNFHQEYHGTDAYYYWIGLIGFSILFFLYLFEVLMDSITKRGKKLFRLNYIFKLIGIITVLSRISTFSFWIYFDKYGMKENLLIIDEVILAIGNVASFAIYYGVILMWVALVSNLKELSHETTEVFRSSRRIFFIILAINLPIQLVFSVIYAILPYTWATFIYLIAVILSLLGAIIWSSVYVVKLHSKLQELRLPVAERKNNLVGATNVLAVILILANVFFLVRDSTTDHLKYLEGLSFLRFTEIPLSATIVFSMENYLLLPLKKNIKSVKKGFNMMVSSSGTNDEKLSVNT